MHTATVSMTTIHPRVVSSATISKKPRKDKIEISFFLIIIGIGGLGILGSYIHIVHSIKITRTDGASSIVVLTCKNKTWIDLEEAVEAAEHNLARSYQNLMDAQDGRGNVSNMEVSVSDNLAILGSKIEQLEVGRRQIKELEEMYSEVVVAENQGVQPNIEQVGDDVQTSDLHVAAPANIGFVTASSEVERNVEVTSSHSDVASAAVIERDHGATGYFSVLSNKKEKQKAEKEKAEKALKEKAEMAEKEKKEGKKN